MRKSETKSVHPRVANHGSLAQPCPADNAPAPQKATVFAVRRCLAALMFVVIGVGLHRRLPTGPRWSENWFDVLFRRQDFKELHPERQQFYREFLHQFKTGLGNSKDNMLLNPKQLQHVLHQLTFPSNKRVQTDGNGKVVLQPDYRKFMDKIRKGSLGKDYYILVHGVQTIETLEFVHANGLVCGGGRFNGAVQGSGIYFTSQFTGYGIDKESQDDILKDWIKFKHAIRESLYNDIRMNEDHELRREANWTSRDGKPFPEYKKLRGSVKNLFLLKKVKEMARYKEEEVKLISKFENVPFRYIISIVDANMVDKHEHDEFVIPCGADESPRDAFTELFILETSCGILEKPQNYNETTFFTAI